MPRVRLRVRARALLTRRRRAQWARARRRLHLILDGALGADRVSLVVHRALIVLVVVSVAAVVLETVPSIEARYGAFLRLVEISAVIVFTLEYALRLWCAPEQTPLSPLPAWRARLAYAGTPAALIDLVAIAPFYFSFVLHGDLRVLLLRLLRFFKLARYSPGMRSLVAALEAERKALGASVVILLGLVLISASAMHIAERAAQPAQFGSIPLAMWWAVVTLTTVGYGDVVPVTLAGRIVAGFTMLGGLMMLALPIGIVATAFADQIHRREFVVTWGMIARVPLFSSLGAHEIAEIMGYLRARSAPVGGVIVRRGEPGRSMFFIASGDVHVELPAGTVRLGEGQFFGEIGLMRGMRRTATVRAATPVKLLVLDAGDLHLLMERNPDIGRRIEAIIEERLDAATQRPSGGDFGGSSD